PERVPVASPASEKQTPTPGDWGLPAAGKRRSRLPHVLGGIGCLLLAAGGWYGYTTFLRPAAAETSAEDAGDSIASDTLPANGEGPESDPFDHVPVASKAASRRSAPRQIEHTDDAVPLRKAKDKGTAASQVDELSLDADEPADTLARQEASQADDHK